MKPRARYMWISWLNGWRWVVFDRQPGGVRRMGIAISLQSAYSQHKHYTDNKV